MAKRKRPAVRGAKDVGESAAAFAQDIIMRIVNVHWDDRLAVEFFDRANGAPPVPLTSKEQHELSAPADRRSGL